MIIILEDLTKENILIIKSLKSKAKRAKIKSKRNDHEIVNELPISMSSWRAILKDGKQILSEKKSKGLNTWINKQLKKD